MSVYLLTTTYIIYLLVTIKDTNINEDEKKKIKNHTSFNLSIKPTPVRIDELCYYLSVHIRKVNLG